jgi:general stress protein 26
LTDTIPLVLDDEIRDAIDTAFDSGHSVTISYIGPDGWPHVSPRGTTQVLDDQQLAMWVRKRDDGLATAIAENPRVTLFYMELAQRRVLYTLYGNAHVSDDPELVERVWEASPEAEKARDPERKGLVVVIDLTSVAALGSRNFVMRR